MYRAVSGKQIENAYMEVSKEYLLGIGSDKSTADVSTTNRETHKHSK